MQRAAAAGTSSTSSSRRPSAASNASATPTVVSPASVVKTPPSFPPPPPPPPEANVPSTSSLGAGDTPQENPQSQKNHASSGPAHTQSISQRGSRNALTPGGTNNATRSSSRPTASTGTRWRNTPHLPNFQAPPVSAALMHWSRAPVHGALPMRNFRAHSVSLVDGVAWLFGGTDENGCWNNVYCLDLETFQWTSPEMMGDLPPPCRAHSATVVGTSILIFGGGDGSTYYNHLYVLDTGTLTHRWENVTPSQGSHPPPRRAHTAILHDQRVYIFGGGTGIQALGDLWSLDVSQPKETWERITCLDRILRLRGYHSANLVNDSMVVIGGSDGGMCFNDIWILDLITLVWKDVKTDVEESPTLLAHSATQVGSYLFVIGGHDNVKYRHDVRLFNLITLKFESKAIAGRSPVSRGYHASLLWDSRIFLFGGFDGQIVYDDVWILDLAASSYLAQVTVFRIDAEDDDGDFATEDEGIELQDEDGDAI
ncbi:hypothetical protein BS47DRAFT_1302329 [Hydnum rufescens UP504]|uniref:Galactose oxidase n=1 Tax=Hydnum rufescens UP504 TaxID=1448309 RepID=A0A9P6DRU0_9AGAM|nr:hypothetical protein BS47DRAFT_1302329 [Hydnum rufescens UP504]